MPRRHKTPHWRTAPEKITKDIPGIMLVHLRVGKYTRCGKFVGDLGLWYATPDNATVTCPRCRLD